MIKSKTDRELSIKALKMYEQYIKDYPDDVVYYSLLGYYHIYIPNMILEKTKEAVDKALAIDPEDSISTGNLCEIFLKQERTDEALVLLEKILKINPEFKSRLWFLLGKVYHVKGRLEDAIKCLNTSHKQYSQDPKVLELRDQILTDLKKQD